MIRDDEEKRETKEEGGNNIKWTTGRRISRKDRGPKR
jgi:hypothetical protein